MGSEDVVLDISDYMEPHKLPPRKNRRKGDPSVVEEFKDFGDDFPGSLQVDVVLDGEECTTSPAGGKSTHSGGADDVQSTGSSDTAKSDPRGDQQTVSFDVSSDNIFGDIEETDALVAKQETLSEMNDSNRLFSTLSSQFKRQPSLAGIKSVELQLGQSEVVEPVGVRRLIRKVQDVIQLVARHTVSDTPIVDE